MNRIELFTLPILEECRCRNGTKTTCEAGCHGSIEFGDHDVTLTGVLKGFHSKRNMV